MAQRRTVPEGAGPEEAASYGPLSSTFPSNSAAINPGDQQRLASLVGTPGIGYDAGGAGKGIRRPDRQRRLQPGTLRRRAEGIRDYLVNSLGVAPERVIVNYFGQAMATRQQANPTTAG
jgi:outer membrane protein OmpA-like peptidoglycan-associated protein